MKIKECTELVKQILKEKPITRNDRNALVVEVLERIEPGITDLPFNVVVPRLTMQGRYPTLETIRRTAQKIQEHYPELAPTEDVESFRRLNEHKFFEFSIQRKV